MKNSLMKKCKLALMKFLSLKMINEINDYSEDHQSITFKDELVNVYVLDNFGDSTLLVELRPYVIYYN